jgi:Ca2+-binding EF-hand superfamily protein
MIRMATKLSVVGLLLLSAALASAAPKVKIKTKAAKKPVTKPAIVKKPAGVDYCKSILLPNLTVQRAQFFAAAGKDSELTAKECDAAKGKAPFQPVDRWSNLVKFDRSKNGQIDWFEFRAFREDVRKKLIKQFDISKNVRLEGNERAKANALLARGKLPGIEPKPSHGPGRGDRGGGDEERARRREKFMKKYDTDGDGELSAAEREAMHEEMGNKWRKDMIQKYDTDGDGVVSAEERAVAERTGGEQVKWGFWMQDAERKCFDDDGDGEVSPAERKVAKEFGKKMAKLSEDLKTMSQDADGDGKVSKKEATIARNESVQVGMRMMQNAQKFADYDGDGTASPEEFKRFRDSMGGAVRTWMDREISKYDTDGDGRVSAKEREIMAEGVRKEWMARMKRYDTNKDGRTGPKEWEPLLYDLGRELKIIPEAKE